MSAPHPRPPHRYLPGIDGLRALSVLAVIGYHLDLPFLRGGFLGVDTFFVISGFLITDLLLTEKRETGRVHLGRFWLRRARRLLPALWLVLAVVAGAVTVVGGDAAAGLRNDVLAALGYVSNWWQVAADTSYVARFGPPPPLLHLWSLAVEEQFYLVWPLLLAGLVLVLRKRALLAGFALLAATASAGWMWLAFTPGTDPSRVYYGTDTHAFGLLLGAALALAVGAKRLRTAGSAGCEVLGVLGVASLLGLGYLTVTLDDSSTFAYRGGIALASVAAVVVVAAAAAPGVFGRALGLAPLRWLGLRSYGVYLWHWPVIALTAGLAPDLAQRWPVRAAEVAVAVLLAAFSWRFVERPVQRLGILGSLRALGAGLVARRSSPGRRLAPFALAGVAALAVTGCVVAPEQNALQAQLQAGRRSLGHATVRPTPTPGTSTTASVSKPARTAVSGDDITAVGDSVMLAAAPALNDRFPGIYVDADDSRSMLVVPDLLAGQKSQGVLRHVVVVGVADNGGVTPAVVDQVVHVVGRKRTLVFVSTPLRDSVGTQANGVMRDAAARHRNVRIADWAGYAHQHPQNLLPDGVHPRPHGAHAYAKLVKKAAERPRRPKAAHPRTSA